MSFETSAREPSISVVTVTLNAERELPAMLASLRNQTDHVFDLIVIDGASTDNTMMILGQSGDIVTYVKSEPDFGLYDAINKGVEVATTDFYLVLGADDVLYPDAIGNYKRLVACTNADVIVAGVKVGNRIRKGYFPSRRWLGHSAMITSHSVGMLIRTGLHDQIGKYPLRYSVLADGYVIKEICKNTLFKVVAGEFIAGVFSTGGTSNRHFVRVLCETWQIQLETGENPLVQYLVFMFRLIRYAPKIIFSED